MEYTIEYDEKRFTLALSEAPEYVREFLLLHHSPLPLRDQEEVYEKTLYLMQNTSCENFKKAVTRQCYDEAWEYVSDDVRLERDRIDEWGYGEEFGEFEYDMFKHEVRVEDRMEDALEERMCEIFSTHFDEWVKDHLESRATS